MKKILMLLAMTLCSCQWATAQRFTDNLGRGLVAVPVGSAGNSKANFVSWRRLADEYYGVTYNLYKNGTKIASNLTTTSYNDGSNAPTSTKYKVAAVVNGEEQTPCAETSAWSYGNAYKPDNNHRYAYGYLDIVLSAVYDRDGTDVTAHYQPNDAEMADLDGDGELEIIIKRINTYDAGTDNGNGGTKDMYAYDSKEFVVLDAYDVNWQTGAATLMWRIDCGPNMVSMNSTEINIIAYDWDEDGKAEVVLRGADNMIVYGSNGKTQLYTVGDMMVNTRNLMTSHSNAQYAWTKDGAEYLIYLNGATGQKYQIMDYPLTRESATAWGKDSKGNDEGYGHRSSKYFFGAPFLDGRKASLFMARGIYARHKMAAMDLNTQTHTWSTRWTWGCNTVGSNWYGQGYHNFVVADVDEDGRDEIVYGSMVIDDNGKGLSTTGLGHGDAQHIGDFDPYRKGLEFFGCNEDKPAMNYRNATTSEIYFRHTTSVDDGRCLMGKFSSTIPGCLGRSVSTGLISSIKDAVVADGPSGNNDGLFWSHLNFRIYWDEDLGDEILDSPGTEGAPAVWDNENGRLFVSRDDEGASMNNDSKNNPCFQGDILGDWREEIVVRCGQNLRVYTTGIGTAHTMPTLWFDHQYRQAMVWQMMAYNQPPHVSYFLGELEGITLAPPPLTNRGRTEIAKDGTISTALNNKHVLYCDNNSTASSFSIAEGARPSVITVNTPIWVQGHDDNNNITTTTYTHTLKGAALSGATRLVKQGGGTLKLNGSTHTHTGQTDVWGGTLEFNGTMQNSALWLNRFTTLRSNGTFGGGITADYGSTIVPGGEDNKGTITTTALTLNHGARLLLDVYSNITADHVCATTLTVNTKTGDNWVNYGPQYLKPVIEIVAHGTLPNGTYDLGTIGTLTGDVTDILLEGVSGATLSYTSGHLCLVVGNGIATFCPEPVIAENSLQTTSEGVQLPKVDITPTTFSYDNQTVMPAISATFADLEGGTAEAELKYNIYYTQDYESATDASSWTNGAGTLELVTGDVAYGKYIHHSMVGTSIAANRSAYTLFNVSMNDVKTYNIEFDSYLKAGNVADRSATDFVVMSEGAVIPTTKNIGFGYNGDKCNAAGTNYLFRMTAANSQNFTINESTALELNAAWTHFVISVNTELRTATYSLTQGNTLVATGTLAIPNGTKCLPYGLFILDGRGYGESKFDNINIYATDHYEYTFTEPGTLTVTASYEGCAPASTDYDAKFVGVTIGNGGWATLGCRYPLELSNSDLTASGLEAAYVANEKKTNSVGLYPVTSAPANTGLLLKGSAGTYRLPITTSPQDAGINMLHAVSGHAGYTVNTDDVYVLANKNNGVGFYLCEQGVTVPAGKAYLQIPGTARSFIGFGEMSGIDTAMPDSQLDEPWYTPTGVRIYQPRKGLYIRGHKKVIVK